MEDGGAIQRDDRTVGCGQSSRLSIRSATKIGAIKPHHGHDFEHLMLPDSMGRLLRCIRSAGDVDSAAKVRMLPLTAPCTLARKWCRRDPGSLLDMNVAK